MKMRPPEDTPKWYALYTRPRHEKFVEEQFLKKGIDAFTPKITLKRSWSDRIKEVKEPLFKSYCFARFPISEKRKIVTQMGVIEVVNFNKRYPHIDESVISSLKIIEDKELRMDPCPYISKGDLVVIKKGHLKGLEGYVVEKRDKNTTLVISVDAIGASIRCVVCADSVDLF